MKKLLTILTILSFGCTSQYKPSMTVKTEKQAQIYLHRVEAMNRAGARTDSLEKERQRKAHEIQNP